MASRAAKRTKTTKGDAFLTRKPTRKEKLADELAATTTVTASRVAAVTLSHTRDWTAWAATFDEDKKWVSRSGPMPEINIPITICGLDMVASIEYTVTDPGRKGGRDFPTEPMEFEAGAVRLMTRERYDLPGWLEHAIRVEYDDRIYTAIQDNEGF